MVDWPCEMRYLAKMFICTVNKTVTKNGKNMKTQHQFIKLFVVKLIVPFGKL